MCMCYTCNTVHQYYGQKPPCIVARFACVFKTPLCVTASRQRCGCLYTQYGILYTRPVTYHPQGVWSRSVVDRIVCYKRNYVILQGSCLGTLVAFRDNVCSYTQPL